ncbi:MAG: 6-phosphofructokinase, partial [Rhodospirillaceae bacterium]
GIPKTIDNDVGVTENSIGYLTAVDVATEALDRLQPTAASHDRVMVLEVMGRDAGHIALSAGIAGGADAILLPEIPWSVEGLAGKIRRLSEGGRNFALVVVAEAARLPGGTTVGRKGQDGSIRLGGVGQRVGELIEDATGADTRVTVLGHVQRGGMPNSRDRLFASAFGVYAVDLIAAGRFDRMVAWASRGVIDIPLEDAIREAQVVDPEGALAHTARGLGIYLGDD